MAGAKGGTPSSTMTVAMSHLQKVLDASGKKSLFSLIFSMEGLKMFADGNIAFNKLIKGPTQGTLVGEDPSGIYYQQHPRSMPHLLIITSISPYCAGNKYYENNDLPYSIPAEWHGWVNYINDYPPTLYDFKKPKYAVEHYVTRTGRQGSYMPKGMWGTPVKRNWKNLKAAAMRICVTCNCTRMSSAELRMLSRCTRQPGCIL
ncbi:NADH dehydrogenase [ubiquinone] 1 alpha subcomplex subunit 12, partial [Haematococcus lacustris]